MTTLNENLHSRIESFLNLNYPCDCDSDDKGCGQNSPEAQHIVEIFSSTIIKHIEEFPEEFQKEELVSSLKLNFAYKKEVSHE